MTAYLDSSAPTTVSAPPRLRQLAEEQLLGVASQGLAGAGNLGFALIAVRLLGQAEFATLATFLALYLLLMMPALGLSASTSIAPEAEARTRRRAARVGLVAAALLLMGAVPLAKLLHLPVAMVVLLGVAAPSAGPLALARGRLYGTGQHRAAAISLVIEPVARMTIGLWLTSRAGAVGGAVGVVAAGYIALLVARTVDRRAGAYQAVSDPSSSQRGVASATAAAFLLLVVMQNQDLVLANRLLAREGAALFAALSMVGGIAAFATSTIPLVLLPRATAPPSPASRVALYVALAVAAALGGLAAAAGALAPPGVFAGVLGQRYEAVAELAGMYLLAMALLGVARVMVAHQCAAGRARLMIALVAASAALQAGCIIAAPRTPAAVAVGTLTAMATLVIALAVTNVLPRLPLASRTARRRLRLSRPSVSRTGWIIVGLTALALGLRLRITRGIWVDEATSIMQARMSFWGMLDSLQSTDVHPPGYGALLWVWTRAVGTGELAVRMPSILLGAALVPMVYLAGRALYDRRAGLVAAAFAALAPQAVWYGQETRMYALFMVLAVTTVWAQARILAGAARAWVPYTLASAALLYTQYFSVLHIAAQQLVFCAAWVYRARHGKPLRRDLAVWAASLLAIAILIAPLIPFADHQMTVNEQSGRGFAAPSRAGAAVSGSASELSPYVFFANLLWAAWGYHSDATMTALGALWPGGMLLGLLLLGRGRSRSTGLLLAVITLPVVVLYAVGFVKRDLFDLRYFIGIVPMLCLLGARAATTWPRSRIASVAVSGLLAVTLVAGLLDQQLNEANPRRYDFKPALRTVEARARPGDVILCNPGYLISVVHYYAPQLSAQPNRPQALSSPGVSDARSVFLLGSFFNIPSEKAAMDASYRQLGGKRRLVREWQFANVKVWEFR